MKSIINHRHTAFTSLSGLHLNYGRTLILFALALLLGSFTFKIPPERPGIDAKELIGTWQVDLRAKPSDPPYLQEFVITSVNGNSFSGTFYNTEIKEGRINTEWGVIAFAFVTSDGSGAYNTSGRLRDGKLEGTTHSIGRDFLMPWSAEKKNTK